MGPPQALRPSSVALRTPFLTIVNYNGADQWPDRAANFAPTSCDFVQMREQLRRLLSSDLGELRANLCNICVQCWGACTNFLLCDVCQ